ncbi:MAG: O-antigen ligase family protein [Candidatus Marinimicrobia bacterium]|nr:O-antigen ligase family protein [Candidatus Neomarinimicrobiota bacterium]
MLFVAILAAFSDAGIRAFALTVPLFIITWLNPILGIVLNFSGYFILHAFFDLVGAQSGILLSMLVLLCISLIRFSLSEDIDLSQLKIHPWILNSLLILMIMFGVIYSADKAYGAIKTIRFILFNGLLFTIPLIIRFDREKIIDLIFFTALAVSFLGWTQIIYSLYFSVDLSARVSIIPSINEVWMGRIFSTGIILSFALAFGFKIKTKGVLYLLLSTPGMFWGILVVGTRGPMLTAIMALFIIILFHKKRTWSEFITIFSGLLIVFAIFIIFFVRRLSVFSSRILLNPADLQTDISTLHRLWAWAKCFELIPQNFLLGIGTGGFRPVGIALFPWLNVTYAYPHNLFLEILTENGIIAFVLFIALLISVVKALINLYKNHYDMFLCLIVLFLHFFLNAMVSGDITMNSDLWLVMGLIFAANTIQVKSHETKN